MASTLLAVDDSVTMRRVLEITFAGTDLHVITANTPDAALARLQSDKPDLVIADATLEPKSGYDLCAAIKHASPGTRVLILSSKQTPFDVARGSTAGADDHMDKPFDTQLMIDKVRKLLDTKATVAAVAPAQPGRSVTQPSLSSPVTAAPPQGRARTLMFGNSGTSGQMPAIDALKEKLAPTPAAPAHAPAAAKAPETTQTYAQFTPPAGVAVAKANPPAIAAPTPAVTAAHGQMTAKLGELGLTPAQVEAVLALSREVVERVVWEVVPVLAETLIKEELSRLTK